MLSGQSRMVARNSPPLGHATEAQGRTQAEPAPGRDGRDCGAEDGRRHGWRRLAADARPPADRERVRGTMPHTDPCSPDDPTRAATPPTPELAHQHVPSSARLSGGSWSADRFAPRASGPLRRGRGQRPSRSSARPTRPVRAHPGRGGDQPRASSPPIGIARTWSMISRVLPAGQPPKTKNRLKGGFWTRDDT